MFTLCRPHSTEDSLRYLLIHSPPEYRWEHGLLMANRIWERHGLVTQRFTCHVTPQETSLNQTGARDSPLALKKGATGLCQVTAWWARYRRPSGAESNPSWQPAKKRGPQSFNQKEVKSTNSPVSREEAPHSWRGPSPASTYPAARDTLSRGPSWDTPRMSAHRQWEMMTVCVLISQVCSNLSHSNSKWIQFLSYSTTLSEYIINPWGFGSTRKQTHIGPLPSGF